MNTPINTSLTRDEILEDIARSKLRLTKALASQEDPACPPTLRRLRRGIIATRATRLQRLYTQLELGLHS